MDKMRELFSVADSSWHPLLTHALTLLCPQYVNTWFLHNQWLPDAGRIFSAFSIPKSNVSYVLLGESPYPRQESANGYAFWDQAVQELWSETGLSKPVNRATSLRNFVKMLLRAEGVLSSCYTQTAIQNVDTRHFVKTLDALFLNLLKHGFLLLNASLIWSEDKPMRYHAKHWKTFIEYILQDLIHEKHINFLLFGKIAQQFNFLPPERCIIAEHPYVLSFIENPEVLNFFQPLHLLRENYVNNSF